MVLRRWLRVREKLKPKSKALFISYNTLGRLSRNGIFNNSFSEVIKEEIRLIYQSSKRPAVRTELRAPL